MENKKKQTAVDWLRNEFHKVPQSQFGNLFEQAKEIERQQIIEAAQWMPEPFMKLEFLPELGNLYYNETYKK